MEERKKLLWVGICIGLLVIVSVGFGVILVNGGKARGANDPASLFPKASPRISNPEDYAKPGASLAPSASPDANLGDDIVVMYGQDASASPGGLLASPMASALAPQGTVDVSIQASPPAKKPGWASSEPALKNAATPAPKSVPAAKSAPKASPKPRLVTVSEYWIQAASFKSRGKADELKSSLAENGLSSVITTKDMDGQTYYRVRIGPYSTKSEASGWLGRIAKLPNCAEAYISKASVQRTK
jgi:cell division septation protein DedD